MITSSASHRWPGPGGARLQVAFRSFAARLADRLASGATGVLPAAPPVARAATNDELRRAVVLAQDGQGAAERALRRQSESLAVLAHELRAPLAPIRTAAALLVRLPATALPNMQHLIERQVAHLSRLVDDLLDVSRVDSGKLSLDCRPVDVAAIVEQAIEAARPAVEARRQRLRFVRPPHEFPVHGDAVRLAQVAGNLLDNASKYTPEGGAIAVSLAMDTDAVVLTVSDSGIGIAADALPHIFTRFFQEPAAMRFDRTGLGIGLTLVRELLDAHGGHVVARSAGTGRGSEFVVSLPRLAKPGAIDACSSKAT